MTGSRPTGGSAHASLDDRSSATGGEQGTPGKRPWPYRNVAANLGKAHGCLAALGVAHGLLGGVVEAFVWQPGQRQPACCDEARLAAEPRDFWCCLQWLWLQQAARQTVFGPYDCAACSRHWL